MLYELLTSLGPRLDAVGLGWLASLMYEIEFRALLAAGVSFLFVVAFGRRTIAALLRMKIGDAGMSDAEALRAHAKSKSSTPTMGGVLICGSILFSTLMLADLGVRYVHLGLVVVLWLGVLGGFDDWLKLTAARRGTGRQGLYAWEKLVFQLGLGLLVGYFAYNAGLTEADPEMAHVVNIIGQRTFEPGGEIAAGLLYMSRGVYIAVAIMMIAGLSNAVNITDGMDGLASGIATAVAFGLMILAVIAGTEGFAQRLLVPHVPYTEELAVMAGAMAGACLGFLWWNCAPAMVFMGDTGSLALGGLIGYIAIVIRQELLVLIMCGVFLFEIASVVMQVGYFKATKGKRIFRCAPVHHHFHLGGWTEGQVVARAWIVSILLAVLALASLKVR